MELILCAIVALSVYWLLVTRCKGMKFLVFYTIGNVLVAPICIMLAFSGIDRLLLL